MKILYTLSALVAIVVIAGGVMSLSNENTITEILIPQAEVAQDEYVDNTGDVVGGLPETGSYADDSITSTANSESIVNSDTITSSWKIYRNDELEITFKYPNEWGKIKTEREEVCNLTFGGNDGIRESSQTGDPCTSVSVGLEKTRYYVNEYGTPTGRISGVYFDTFLYSLTPLYVKYAPGRDGNWTSNVRTVMSDASFNDYANKCNNISNCEVFTNKNGVRIIKSFQSGGGMGTMLGWKYLIKSPNPFFSAIVIGSLGKYEDPKHKEFDFLVNSLKFISL